MLSITAGLSILFVLCRLSAYATLAQAWDIEQNSTQQVSELTGFPPCDALITAGLGNRLLVASSDSYEPRVQSWWDAAARLRPWCLVQPYTTEEVSTAVKALAGSGHGAGDWHVAIRSGGHSRPGTNNVVNGVTVDLGMMNHSRYHADQNIASVEPGAAWKDVYYDLLRNGNATVTGARDGGVGVGGFLLGGGLSYYTWRNGFSCDTVINYEVVLANGSIVEANANDNHDLWKALKGGGLNFGIVTRFDMQAMPAVQLAYGQAVVSSNYTDQIIETVTDFANWSGPSDDALITMYTHDTSISEDITVLLIGTNTKANLSSTGFDKVRQIPALASSWELTSLADAANDSQVPAGMLGFGTTLTLLNSPSILRQSVDLHGQLATSLSGKIGPENFTTQMFLQPLPSYLSTIGENKGGNMLGLERISSNAIIWTGGLFVINGDEEAAAIAHLELSAMTEKLKDLATADGKAAELIYMNYADTLQDVLGSYGPDKVAFMKDVAERYDPDGFWQKRVPGGFKILRVANEAH